MTARRIPVVPTIVVALAVAAMIALGLWQLLDRLPKLRLDDRAPPVQMTGALQARGINHLQVRFD